MRYLTFLTCENGPYTQEWSRSYSNQNVHFTHLEAHDDILDMKLPSQDKSSVDLRTGPSELLLNNENFVYTHHISTATRVNFKSGWNSTAVVRDQLVVLILDVGS